MAKALPEEELPVGDIIEQHLPALFKTYPNLNHLHPSSWFVFNADGKHKLHLGESCHANMTLDGTGWDDVITAVPKSDKIGLAYQRMLINGPFKGFSDLIQLKKSVVNHPPKKDEEHGSKEDFYYLHTTDLEDWPANVLYNYIIASRIPIEKPAWLKPWWKGVEQGFNPVLSFLLSFSTDGLKYDGERFKAWVSNHNWFDNASDWSRIMKGDMTRMSKPFKTNPNSCAPCNVIWGSSKETPKLSDMTAEQISEHFGLAIEPPAADPPKPAGRPKNHNKFVLPHFYHHNPGILKPPLMPLHNLAAEIPMVIHDEVAVGQAGQNFAAAVQELLDAQAVAEVANLPPDPLPVNFLDNNVNFEDVHFANPPGGWAIVQDVPDPQPEIEDHPLDHFEWDDDEDDEF